jgi:redox-sensitive bicupin YhaK (pirin superfamily)
VTTFSATLYLDIQLEAEGELALTGLPLEAAIYVVTGTIDVDGAQLATNTMAYLEPGTGAHVSSKDGAQFVVIGGEPLDGPRYILWNFVSSSKERLARAAADWESQRFDLVPGDSEFIPLPKPLHSLE